MPAEAPSPSPATPPGTRDRLIAAMTDALRRRGFHGVGVSDILQQAGAPKGVLYHHFPGGKAELAVAAIDQGFGQLQCVGRGPHAAPYKARASMRAPGSG